MALSSLIRRPGERVVLATILALALLALGLAARSPVPIAWAGYAGCLVPVGLFVAIGGFYRLSGRSEAIAAPMIAIGLLFPFSNALATLNYLLLPVSRPLIDPWLFETNAIFHYRWSEWVAWGAAHPTISFGLSIVYQSVLAQILLILLILGFTRRFEALDRMSVTLVLGAVSTVGFWTLFPSISVSAFESVPIELERLARPVVDMAEGARLLSLVTVGPERISVDNMTGVIGFPSFHTVIACLCLRFAWEVPIVRWIALALNIAMVPAILLHGSHHVVDMIGGVLFFFLSLVLADQALRLARTASRRALPEPAALA